MERHWKAQTPVLIKARRHYLLNFLFLESLRLFLEESIRQSVFSDRGLKVLLGQEAIVEESTLSDVPVTAGSARPLGKHSWNDRCWFYGEKIKRHMHIQCLANNIEIVPAALCRNIRWSRFITAWKWRIKYNKKPHRSSFIGINSRNSINMQMYSINVNVNQHYTPVGLRSVRSRAESRPFSCKNTTIMKLHTNTTLALVWDEWIFGRGKWKRVIIARPDK